MEPHDRQFLSAAVQLKSGPMFHHSDTSHIIQLLHHRPLGATELLHMDPTAFKLAAERTSQLG